MRGKGWLYAYGASAILHGLSFPGNLDLLRFVTKPLLMPFLLMYFLSQTRNTTAVRHWISAALLFSWLGDIFLMNEGELYFIAGLGAFLLAHIFYIFFFAIVRSRQITPPGWQIAVLIALGLYVGLFYNYLAPNLSTTLKLPVLLYALVIAAMFIMAYHAFPNKKTGTALWCIFGAGLFIASDSMLAVHNFVQVFPGAGLAIMGTYILAQLAIARGAIEVVNHKLNTV